jgi:hydrogenase-4 component B
LINILILILLSALIAVLLFNTKGKGIITVSTVIVLGIITSYFALMALIGKEYELILSGPELFGKVPVKIDALSAWFILTINFTLITGAVYGFNYMKSYRERKNDITLHCVAFILAHFALLGICSVQNGFIILLLWELMAISVFLLVIFDHHKPDTIKAGIIYLVQSHISIVFLMLGFIYVA